jgi:tetratricopeptide (TPR) repeat protein
MKARCALLVLACLLIGSRTARAQTFESPQEFELGGLEASAAESEAWAEVQGERYIRARELAERVLARDRNSYVAHLVLAHAYHYAEANLPKALYELDLGLVLFTRKFGDPPHPDQPWRWHAELLRELIDVHGDLEHHEQKLAYIARYNELYDPDMIAERAWPLMKLGRYKEARLAAQLGMAEERGSEHVIALNALCAIEFEAGNDGASYDACRRAIDDSPLGRGTSAVDLTNFAEASRSMFKLDEAERVILQATAAVPSWYGNPWLELGELYVRQGRIAEALAALRQVAPYRQKRPPHVRDADRNEQRRALAAFLLVAGKPQAAIDITDRALNTPDRRAHNSRDSAQDESVLALLDRLARLTAAEQVMETAAVRPWYEAPKYWLQAESLRWDARQSGARVERLLADDARLVGSFRIGAASAAIMPPWLLGDLVSVLGAGVVREAVTRAARRDHRPGASAYYDAVEAEAAWRAGDEREAEQLATRALGALGASEVLLQARLMAIAGDAAYQRGDLERARSRYGGAFDRDPGVLRRLGLALPVEVSASGGDVADDTADLLAGSPRFESQDGGLGLQVSSDGTAVRVCLAGEKAQLLACADVKRKRAEDGDDFSRRAAKEALDQLFAPKVDLSQSDINGLDGQNLSGRDALESVFDE